MKGNSIYTNIQYKTPNFQSNICPAVHLLRDWDNQIKVQLIGQQYKKVNHSNTTLSSLEMSSAW